MHATGDATRARHNGAMRSPVFGATPFPVVARRRAVVDVTTSDTPARKTAFPIGTRVFHQKFGYGTVTSVEGNRLEVAFEKAGPKRVIDTFVEQVS